MQINPFRRKSKVELARKALLEAAEQAEKLADPVPTRARRPIAVVVAGTTVFALIYAWRRSADSAADLPSPDVIPTAPLGPTDGRLNDPALKAKVESELFNGTDVPKGRVSIGVADGVVTLRGRLDTTEQTTTLTAAAEQIEGVRRVENLLTT